jgi:hypothetical protein
MKDTFQAFVDEVKALADTKAFWFLLGLSVSGTSVPNIVETVRTFAGV